MTDITVTAPNPKQIGSNLIDAVPQIGPCPNNCNQCFYNRPGAFFVPIDRPHMPHIDEAEGKIVRVNSGHDSNIHRDMVIANTRHYPDRFFNTAIPNVDFPAPVVLTVNPKEEEQPHLPSDLIGPIENLMFVRLRVSGTNLHWIWNAALEWAAAGVPVVLTFMAYYDTPEGSLPKVGLSEEATRAMGVACPCKFTTDEYTDHDWHGRFFGLRADECYAWRKRTLNSYYCPSPEFMRRVMSLFQGYPLIDMCGTPDSCTCADCRNCEAYYWIAKKRLLMTR